MSNTLLASLVALGLLTACGESPERKDRDTGTPDLQRADGTTPDLQRPDLTVVLDGQARDVGIPDRDSTVLDDGMIDTSVDQGVALDTAQTADQNVADVATVDVAPDTSSDASTALTVPPHLLTVGLSTTSCQIAGPTGLRCWGSLTGLEVAARSPVPADVPILSSLALSGVSAGHSALCAISAGGAAHCVGSGPVGHTTKTTEGYYDVFGLQSGVIDIRVAYEHACSLSDDGTVSCWGRNDYGQLGQPKSLMTSSIIPQVAATSAIRIAVGRYHSCLITSQHTVQCWGRNSNGQLGDGSRTNAESPVDVVGLTDVVEISAGENHTCAVLQNGSVHCWGYNYYGQLGDGSSTESLVPVAVQAISDAVGVSSAATHTCVIHQTSGTVSCWGRNSHGQLGSGSTGEDQLSPVPVVGIAGVVELAAGYYHSCARTATTTHCWGNNSVGQLGYGAPGSSIMAPTAIDLQSGIPTAMCSGGSSSCGLFSGKVRCWGHNNLGQLGTGDTNDSTAPLEVSLPADATAIACGGGFACAASATKVHCWGDNAKGQLGVDPSTLDKSATPLEVAGAPTGISSFSAGSSHVCAVASGSVICWGSNSARQLGRATSVAYDITPTALAGISAATMIHAGTDHACAVVAGGVQCWGANNGAQCGVASSTYVGVTAVAGVQSDITAVAAGQSHSCALSSGGAVKCWGTTATGHTGNFDPVPTDVPTLSSGAKMIASATSTMCAITSADTIVCWGFNANGAVGVGTTDPSYVYDPLEVVGLDITPSVLGVDGVGARFFTWDSTGAMRAWGVNSYGEIGNGFSSIVPTPQTVIGL